MSHIKQEDLIAEVKKHPLLWNKDDNNYKNKRVREQTWKKITSTLTGDWNDLRPVQRVQLCRETRLKWNCIRNSYNRYLHQVKKGERHTKYRLSSYLKFLRPLFASHSCESPQGSMSPSSDRSINPDSEDNLDTEQQSEVAEYHNLVTMSHIKQEDLIAEVKKHPLLWNKNDKNYKNKRVREQTWKKITSTLNGDWNDLSPVQRVQLCRETRLKWNCIRNSYNRYLHQVKKGERHTKYRLSSYLKFLRPLFASHSCESPQGSMSPSSDRSIKPDSEDNLDTEQQSEVAEYLEEEEETLSRDTEIINFILEVKKHPCLWNRKHKYYTQSYMRERAWKTICSALTDNWNDLSSGQRLEIYQEKKRRWTRLRSHYIKILKKGGATERKMWGYLKFLTPFLYIEHNSSNLPLDGSIQSEDMDQEPFAEEYLEEHVESETEYEPQEREHKMKTITTDGYIIPNEFTEEYADYTPPKSLMKGDTPEKGHKMVKRQTEDSPVILNVVPRNDENNYQDEDSQFLLSFRNDLTAMSRSDKLEFKLGMIQLIRNITERSQSHSQSSETT